MPTALILGATGLVGSQLLPRLLDDPRYDKVITYTRRPVELGHSKLLPIVGELADIGAHGASLQADDLYCCLGTTIKQAGSQAAFRAVDFDAPLEAARLQQARGSKRYFLVSSLGADAGSGIFYSRTKGQLEHDLNEMGFQTLGIVRPSLLLGHRLKPRSMEKASALLFVLLNPLLRGSLRVYRSIPANDVASGLIHLSKGLATDACLQSRVFHIGVAA